MKKSEFHRKVADCIDMCEAAGLEPTSKLHGEIMVCDFSSSTEHYEFPLAIVDGKPVFKGDRLYTSDGYLIEVGLYSTSQGVRLSWNPPWNPPKPKAICIEIPFDYAKFLASLGHCGDTYATKVYEHISKSCANAIEGK